MITIDEGNTLYINAFANIIKCHLILVLFLNAT